MICGLIFFFLIAPIAVVIPLSFNSQDFFTFTKEMLSFNPEGYSLKHYRDFFSNPDWQDALWNSVKIAPVATIISVSFGTLAAIGLSQPHVPARRAIMAEAIALLTEEGVTIQPYWRSLYNHTKEGLLDAGHHISFEYHPARIAWSA